MCQSNPEDGGAWSEPWWAIHGSSLIPQSPLCAALECGHSNPQLLPLIYSLSLYRAAYEYNIRVCWLWSALKQSPSLIRLLPERRQQHNQFVLDLMHAPLGCMWTRWRLWSKQSSVILKKKEEEEKKENHSSRRTLRTAKKKSNPSSSWAAILLSPSLPTAELMRSPVIVPWLRTGRRRVRQEQGRARVRVRVLVRVRPSWREP